MTDTFNPLLHNLRPINFQRGTWTPEAWGPAGPENQPNSRLTVVLPGEIATAVALKIVTSNAVVAQLGSCMMTGKGHDYKAKDIVPVRREADGMGGERWTVVSERELQMNDTIQRFEAIEKALAYPAPEEKAKALPSPGKAPGAPQDAQSSDPAGDTSEEVNRVVGSLERPSEGKFPDEVPPGEEDRTVEPEREGWGLPEGDFTSRVRDGDRS
jgi:hypothetical protein